MKPRAYRTPRPPRIPRNKGWKSRRLAPAAFDVGCMFDHWWADNDERFRAAMEQTDERPIDVCLKPERRKFYVKQH